MIMGYIRHHAIVVSSFDEEKLQKVHEQAKVEFSVSVTNIVSSGINCFYTFLVGPDGSNEGWEESKTGDVYRDRFIEYIESFKYEDGSNVIDYCEFFYGDDNHEAGIVKHN